MARRSSFDVVDGTAQEIAERVLAWASNHGESVYAVSGNVAEAAEYPHLVTLSKGIEIEIDIVPAIWPPDVLVGSDVETLSYSAPQASRAGSAFSHLVSVMARLRSPNGCPWDREQTHSSLAIHLLEEAHETLDAIDRLDMKHLAEELGDLLLQIVFHAELADEEGHFEIGDVIDDLVAKLVHRHPHIFGDVQVSGARDVVVNWEALKHEQKERESLEEGIPKSLPALLFAHKVQRRIAGAKREFVPSTKRIIDLASRLDEPGDAASVIGELLFEAVALAQQHGVDPEGALRRAAASRLSSAEEEMP